MKRFVRIVAVSLGAFIACAFFLGWGFSRGFSRPTQRELLVRFNEGRSSFEKLRSMFVEDNLETVGDYGQQFARKPFIWTSALEAGVPDSRAQMYAKLMQETKVKRIDRGEDGSVSISLAGSGMANRGWRISLVSKSVAPTNQLDSIDSFRKSKQVWKDAYSHVADNWYLRIVW